MTDPALRFLDAMQTVFGRLDWLPIADGNIHRFHVPGDKAGTLNGWYVLFLDGIPSGLFGSWKADASHTWSSHKLADPLEAEQVRQRVEQARRQREAERQQRQQAAAEYANRLWRDARRAEPAHPYLIAKGLRSHGLRQHHDRLLIPLYADGQLVNLQRIHPDGAKRFLSSGRIKGAYSTLGRFEPGRPLYVCEGWATGATLHEHTGAAVACAMNAGNLLSVARALRTQYGDSIELVIAGDDDRQTGGNPGRTAANAAAVAVGGKVVFPEWPADAPLNLSDFNDLRQWQEANQ